MKEKTILYTTIPGNVMKSTWDDDVETAVENWLWARAFNANNLVSLSVVPVCRDGVVDSYAITAVVKGVAQ
jgi:hypothetical protein